MLHEFLRSILIFPAVLVEMHLKKIEQYYTAMDKAGFFATTVTGTHVARRLTQLLTSGRLHKTCFPFHRLGAAELSDERIRRWIQWL